MRVSKDHSPSVCKLYRGRWIAAATALLAISACDSVEKRPVGTVGHINGFAGIVAADEPRAALVGRDVLSAGGTAADAATAMYFTLAVTYPSAASLGGGGSCIIHDAGRKKTEVMEFPAMASTMAGAVPSAVPANPRGFFALHAKYGRLRYESLLAEPERLARNGTTVSRAMANDLARALPVLGRDSAAREAFFRPDGSILREGDTMVQPQLASTIANLRRSTGDFYTGLVARDLVTGVQAMGGTLVLEDLRDIKPSWRDPLTVKVGDEIAYFAPPPTVGSTTAAQMIGILWSRWGKASAEERPHLMAETSARVFADRARWMRPNGWTTDAPDSLVSDKHLAEMMAGYNPAQHVPVSGVPAPPTDYPLAASFVAMDASGSTVACGVTTHGLFGLGRIIPGTGIILSGVPGPNGPPAITTMLTINPNTGEVHFAGAASGGGTGPEALAVSFLTAVEDAKPLNDALAVPRLIHPGTPDAVFVETGSIVQDPAALQKFGHKTSTVPMPSRVEALHCPGGYKNPGTCETSTDPRGFGMAIMVGVTKK